MKITLVPSKWIQTKRSIIWFSTGIRKIFGGAFGNVVATFLGAFLAFQLSNCSEIRKEKGDQHEALVAVQIHLCNEFAGLAALQPVLEERLGVDEKGLLLTQYVIARRPKLDTSKLAYLVGKHNRSPELLLKLHGTQQRYEGLLNTIDERNALLLNWITNATSLGTDENGKPTYQIPEGVTSRLQVLTNHIKETIYALMQEILDAHDVAREVNKHVFPGTPFIEINRKTIDEKTRVYQIQ